MDSEMDLPEKYERHELWDHDTEELLFFSPDLMEISKEMMKHQERNLVVVHRTADELDVVVPWDKIKPRESVIIITAEDTVAVNWLFLGLCNLAEDMQKAESPFTERLDDLLDRFFSAVGADKEDE